jgi:lysozyme
MNQTDFTIKHEGWKLKPYTCPAGIWTIGAGHALTKKEPQDIQDYLNTHGEITDEMASRLLAIDLQIARNGCEKLFPAFDSFSDNRKMALIDWMFNLGYPRASLFENTISWINDGQKWDKAAVEILNSNWAKQVGLRAEEDARLIREG